MRAQDEVARGDVFHPIPQFRHYPVQPGNPVRQIFGALDYAKVLELFNPLDSGLKDARVILCLAPTGWPEYDKWGRREIRHSGGNRGPVRRSPARWKSLLIMDMVNWIPACAAMTPVEMFVSRLFPEQVEHAPSKVFSPKERVYQVNQQHDLVEPSANSLALDRTVLANERTYQAWIRTGLALFVAGLGIIKFLQNELPLWLLMPIAILLILFSAVAFLLAAWRYRHLHVRVANLDVETIPLWIVMTISTLLAASAVLALVGLFINSFG